MWKGVGTTAAATTTDAVVEVLSSTNTPRTVKNVRIINAGTIAGFYSLDGGTTWAYLPANYEMFTTGVTGIESIKIKRIASGSNLASVYAEVW